MFINTPNLHTLQANQKAQRLLIYLTLAVIVGLGSYLRLNKVVDDTWWIDGARDVYVARTMWETKQFPLIAPASGAGYGVLNNSPFYYYLLAMVWGLTHSAEGIVYFYTIVNIVLIPINYCIGKELFNSKTSGLMLASFTAFSQILIQYSRHIFQPYLIPTITSAIIYCCLKTLTNKSTKWSYFAVILFVIGANIHLSILTIFPIFLCGLIYLCFKKRNTGSLLLFSALMSACYLVIKKQAPRRTSLCFFRPNCLIQQYTITVLIST